ncbi:hypothetical protein PP568_09780 [Mycobacteroides abscessus]|uniref:hypothetical protein n=1 Tax=Mycobacteroides TaxID=670516 RepID=UPI0005E60821|nr:MULTISPECIES: hypothetical protein [Mycobacteroides]MBN7460697.1 hypothetical protein [Mycobacteroides abscessus subsp. abscessus]MBN7557523.1 hypothetical protein [Mycobacteroides abscessus subsp. abscessus]MDM2407476.1 hypothetical protein [Mycobacteroides abscessus]MDM2414941.1 hypothetical protein [Mycobacteroides abscessus]MDO3012248.1 hypothetical protein [Mycobacteroides abscessus subsp. abscessus]
MSIDQALAASGMTAAEARVQLRSEQSVVLKRIVAAKRRLRETADELASLEVRLSEIHAGQEILGD